MLYGTKNSGLALGDWLLGSLLKFNSMQLYCIYILSILYFYCVFVIYTIEHLLVYAFLWCFKVLPKQQLTWNFFESQNGGPNESSDAKNDDPESSLTWSDANCSARKESSVDSASFEFWISRDADSKFRFKIWKYKNRCFENWCLMG